MIDISKTVAPKSDQLNADDLIAGPRTIVVTSVKLVSEDQPVAIHFAGDDGKPYKPCKSMRRVLVKSWGADGAQYIGKSMTIYLDESVRFGGAAVGGIRISHMSHIDKPLTMALTATRAVKKAFTVNPLSVADQPAEKPAADPDLVKSGDAAAADGVEMYSAWLANLTPEQKASIRPNHRRWSETARAADARMQEAAA